MLCLASITGCADAPSAPEEYEELMSFLFTETTSDDTERLAQGVENLARWLEDPENLSKALGGFLLNNSLTEEAVDQLDGVDRKGSGLDGMSFAVKSPHHVEDLVKTLSWEGFATALPHLELYERTFTPEGVDPTCLARRECLFLEATTRVRADWGGLGIMETRENVQFRLVETGVGWVLLHRTWLLEKTALDNSLFDVSIRESFKVTVNLLSGGASGAQLPVGIPSIAGGLHGGGKESMQELESTLCGKGTLRVEARWMDATFSALSDADALEISMGTAKKDATNLDDFMSERFTEIAPTASLIYGTEQGCDNDDEGDEADRETPEELPREESLEGTTPCPDEEDPCEVLPPESFYPSFLLSTIQVNGSASPEEAFNLDPEAGADDCAGTDCSEGADNTLGFLADIANSGLANAIEDRNLSLLGEWIPGTDDTGTLNLYTGIPEDPECDWNATACIYTPMITSWSCDCTLLATMPGTLNEQTFEAGGDDASFFLKIPIETAMLPVTLKRARLRANLSAESGLAFETGLLGGAVQKVELLDALKAFPLDKIGPLTKDAVIAVVETIAADIDTDGDGEDDALSIGISIGGSDVQMTWSASEGK